MVMEIGGSTAHVIDQGSGPALRRLPGGSAPAATYRLIISHLAAYRRVIAPDPPGWGATPEPERAWDLDDYADWILELARVMGIGQATLMGHSFGCRVAIKLLSRPDLPLTVDRAVLMDAAGLRPRRGPLFYGKIAVYKAGRRLLSLPAVRRRFPQALEAWRRRRGSSDYRNASPVMRQSMVLAVNEDLAPLLPAVRVPTLLIWGEDDKATPLSYGKRMKRAIPDAGLVVLEGAGHFAFAERWEPCRRVLDAFLMDDERGPSA